MSGMFANCLQIFNIDLSKFDTTNVENMWQMLDSRYVLTELGLIGFNFLSMSCLTATRILLS